MDGSPKASITTVRRERVYGWWISIGVGVAVMVGHAALRVLTHRLALRQTDRRSFLLFELGGLGARMVLVLGAVTLVLAFIPVRKGAFVGTVLFLLLLSMLFELRLVLRQLDREALE